MRNLEGLKIGWRLAALRRKSGNERICPVCRRPFYWKGGVTVETMRLRRTPAARAWTLAVFKRDAFRCGICGVTKPVEAHHIYPWALFPSLRLVLKNGLTLCKLCHRGLHMLGRHLTKRINERLAIRHKWLKPENREIEL